MKRPLTTLTLIFCLGIFFASRINMPFLWLYGSCLFFFISGLVSFRRNLRFGFFLICFIFSLGGAYFRNSQALPKCHISRHAFYKNNNLYRIRGFIASQPEVRSGKTSFLFRAQEIESNTLKQNCCGNIFVYLKGKNDFIYGEELVISGNLYRPYGFAKSYRDYLYRQNILALMRAKGRNYVVRLNRNCGFILKRLALWLKVKLEKIIFRRLSATTASILDAMLLGEKSKISPLIYNSMIKSGTVHILVVSGFNVGIVSFLLVLFLKLARIPRFFRFYLSIPLLLIYCLLTGASTPVVRSTIMALVFMFAYFVKREPDPYNCCAAAALFILGLNPKQLFDVGFQLSFASVFSIMYLYPKIRLRLRLERLRVRYIQLLLDGALISFSCWIGTAGLVAYYFKLFSPVTVLANLLIVLLATLITLCGFSLLIIELTWPNITFLFAYNCELLVKIMLGINAFIIQLPAAYFHLP